MHRDPDEETLLLLYVNEFRAAFGCRPAATAADLEPFESALGRQALRSPTVREQLPRRLNPAAPAAL